MTKDECEHSLWLVEVESERGEVDAGRQSHQVVVALCRPDERQQPHDAKLVCHHALRDVGHRAYTHIHVII